MLNRFMGRDLTQREFCAFGTAPETIEAGRARRRGHSTPQRFGTLLAALTSSNGAVHTVADMTARAATVLLVISLATLISMPTGAHPQASADDPGVSGYVLAPDGAPVSEGMVIARRGMVTSRAPIDRMGRFPIVPSRPGLQQFLVRVPGHLPVKLVVTVPSSGSLRLPVIRLSAGARFRVRLVSPGGEPLLVPNLHLRLFDANGTPIDDALGDPRLNRVDRDGAVVIEPLPRGIITLAVDTPAFARTRLPDVNVADLKRNLDGGIVVVEQPGATLNVDVVDESGAPVPNHVVLIEDTRPRSPLGFPPERTSPQGRATFTRLAAGPYRVWSTAAAPCAGAWFSASRVVSVATNRTVAILLVIGGRATFRITSLFGAAAAVQTSASPDVPPPPSPPPIRTIPSGCRGVTDREGRVTLSTFPPGPAHVAVSLTNSTYVRAVEIPRDGRDVAITIPDGFVPVHVVNDRNEPVPGASVLWTGGGEQIYATTMATGDALLEGVAPAGGTLTVSAHRYQLTEEALVEPPSILHTVALSPLPQPARLRVRVMTTASEPLSKAVVELLATDSAAVPRVTPTDRGGVVVFTDLPSGSMRLIASAEGFVTSTMHVSRDSAGDVVFTLARGYRVIATVELPPAAGAQLVRVLNDRNQSMDDVLDGASDRRVEPGARVSLGPLAPGAYVLELQGAAGRRQEGIRIVDRDVSVTLR
jgi:hypothetical protein